ncbi:unnamed protein product [Brassicogethes aeneus]|uniref:Uncharacterized protein n=1 Tax=Brassicogethes aeneus TaxID=1431903 RepID=A0A9P0F966_BRAAE|nr:unnamed protein product [Brassicogethes aeneus]
MLVILVAFFLVPLTARSLPLYIDSSEVDDFGTVTTNKMKEIYTVANREEIQEEKTTSQLFLNKLREFYKVDDLGRQQKIEERDYYLVKILNRRNKRYTKRSSYLTLCHFKICNMGRYLKKPLNELPDNDDKYYEK